MRAYQLTGSDSPRLQAVKREDPIEATGHVVVDLHAASLNYRDLQEAKLGRRVIPLSDGAGIISSSGSTSRP